MGRPKSAEELEVFQLRLPLHRAEALRKFVRRRSIAATGNPEALSVAAVLRGLVEQALDAEGAETIKDAPKPTPKPKKAKQPA